MKYITMLYIFGTFLLLLLCSTCGCIHTTPYIVVINSTTVDCTNVQPLYYGKRGDNPSNNDVWKCYDWELHEQK